jgi:hypothetical protein
MANDPIDHALAAYINNYLITHQGMPSLKILFLREAYGVYKYGSKKVFIKIEKSFKLREPFT